MIMRLFTLAVAVVVGFCLTGCGKSDPHSSVRPSDTIYSNATIWTGDLAAPWASAMAVRGDRIVAIGNAADMEKWRGAATRVQNLAGALVLPGFQDSHIHIMSRLSSRVDLTGAATLEDLQQRLRDHARAYPDTPWIQGFGWAYSAFPDQRPLAVHLDEILPDRPVFISARDGHMALVNSQALKRAAIDKTTVDPENGRIVRSADGNPSGELQERAMDLVRQLIPPASEEERYTSFLANMQAAAEVGITAFHEAGVSNQNIDLFERAEREGKLLQRVELALRMVTPEDRHTAPIEAAEVHIKEAVNLRDRLRGPFLQARSVKVVLDGTIDATTAAMFENYVGTNSKGLPFWEPSVLAELVTMYDRAGFQVIQHAIGDKAIAQALNAIEKARQENGIRDSRHRVEHAEMPRLTDLQRFRGMGVIASTQPMFAYPDATVLENFSVLLGHERAQYADNFALWDNAGVRQVFGSDNPVMPLSVLSGIEVAVTRMTEVRHPEGGWYPDGRISVEAAVRHYTSDAAWGTHDERERGTLSVGKFADFIVLENNIFEIEPTQISETRVLLTVLGGKQTWSLSKTD